MSAQCLDDRRERTSTLHHLKFQKCHERKALAITEIGVLQEQGSELLVRAHELPDVVLDFKTGMNNRPKMSCSDECQKRKQILDASAAKGSPQRLPGALGLRRLDKDQRGSGKDPVFNLAVRGGPIDGPIDGRKAAINRFELPPPRRRRREKLERLLDGLRRGRNITR